MSSELWYYVKNGLRQGPVEFKELQVLLTQKALNDQDYVWRKGYENWKKMADCSEVQELLKASTATEEVLPPQIQDTPSPSQNLKLKHLSEHEKSIFLRIGLDRGGDPVEYGPYDTQLLKRLYLDKRINGKTQIFIKGMLETYVFLAEFEDFEDFFNELPPEIPEQDKRKFSRKPMTARMFIQNNKKVFEGVCRDISVGGMQVLMDGFPGKMGDLITINVHPDNSDYHFAASGKVVRILEGGSGFSFRFMNLQEEATQAIKKYLDYES
jgi:hypothetical protein